MSKHRKWNTVRAEQFTSGARSAQLLADAQRVIEAEVAGYHLAEARRARGVTKRELAAKINVTPDRISQIEHGQASSLPEIGEYVAALGGQLQVVADFGDQTVTISTHVRAD